MLSEKVKVFLLQNKVAVSVLVLTTLVAIYFAAKIALNLFYFNVPDHRDQALKSWMTPRYVMMSYSLPRPLVIEIFQLDSEDTKREDMRAIASKLDLSLEELTSLVRNTAREYREKSQ